MFGVSLISSNLFMFQLLAFGGRGVAGRNSLFAFPPNFGISWLLACLSGTVPHSYLRGCLPGLSPQYVHQIKYNSLLLGCTKTELGKRQEANGENGEGN